MGENTAVWADQPYTLSASPLEGQDLTSHSALASTDTMNTVHNLLLRGLNSICLQGPLIPTSDDAKYVEMDVADLLYYTSAWVMTIHHHHHTEETTLFPGIEKLAGEPGLTDKLHSQHKDFEPGLERLREYAETTSPKDYRWSGADGMGQIIDSFGPGLHAHLNEEVAFLKTLTRLDSQALQQVWDDLEKAAKEEGGIAILYDAFPLVLGCCDKITDAPGFPPFPKLLMYAIVYWTSRKHRGAWRFCPSDPWGRRRPLLFSKAEG